MSALDFPLVPNTDSEVTTGDITWKWNGYAWYAASQGDDVYLSKVTDDEAAGLITFKNGVSVTGGAYGADGTAPNQLHVGLSANDGQLYVMSAGDPDNRKSIAFQVGGRTQCSINSLGRFDSKFNNKPDTDTGIGFQTTGTAPLTWGTKGIQSYRSEIEVADGHACESASGFLATTSMNSAANAVGQYIGFSATGITNAATATYAFKTNISAGGGDNYGFFASGDAPNYLAGGVQFDLTHLQGGTQDQLLLNKYEEGTFTTASGNSGLDSFSKDGLSYYQLVGKTVTYAVRIGLNSDGAKTLPAGTYNITGFPFSNVAANSGGVVTFIGTNNSFKSETNASFVSNGPTLRFVVDSNINNVTLIRCTFTVFLT